jgi:hypothetical protein
MGLVGQFAGACAWASVAIKEVIRHAMDAIKTGATCVCIDWAAGLFFINYPIEIVCF